MEKTKTTVTNVSSKLKEKYELELMTGRYNTNHILHLILSILTAGGWIFIWAIVVWRNDVARTKAEEIVYGAGEPNYISRTLGISSFVILIISFFVIIAGINAASEHIENHPTQTQSQTQVQKQVQTEQITIDDVLNTVPKDADNF
jgi:hypothetical protein